MTDTEICNDIDTVLLQLKGSPPMLTNELTFIREIEQRVQRLQKDYTNAHDVKVVQGIVELKSLLNQRIIALLQAEVDAEEVGHVR